MSDDPEVMPEGEDVSGVTEAFLPALDDLTDTPKKARYVYYRVAFFSVKEAIKLAGITYKSVLMWRKLDPDFMALERSDWSEKRQALANNYLNVEFTRNFHLVLTKDFKVLLKAATDEQMEPGEFEYLLKIRPMYTPQHLALIKQMAGELDKGEDFDFTKLTLTIRREREEIIVSKQDGR